MKFTRFPVSLRLFLVFIMMACLLDSAPKNDKLLINVLIVDGFSNHDWKATTQDILSIVAADKQIRCEVSTIPPLHTDEWGAWLPDFSQYDVVIQNTTDIGVDGAWPQPAQSALEDFMSKGGGLYIFHSANNAFPDWDAYNRMIGLGWRPKNFGPAIQVIDGQTILIPAGKGGGTGHGPRVDALVTRLNDHPIHVGLPKQWMAADLEIYRYARGPAENLTVISYARDAKTQMNFPVEWVIQYKAGRVYNSTYGHHWHNQKEMPPGMRCAAFQTILLRAIYWLSGAMPAAETPSDFPSKTKTSIR